MSLRLHHRHHLLCPLTLILVLIASSGPAAEEHLVIGFDQDPAGFVGDQVAFKADGSGGFLRLRHGTGDYAQALRGFDQRRDLVELRLRVRTTNATTLAIRCADATGQEFLHRLPLARDGAWHQVTLAGDAVAHQSWGGADDGRWYAPLTALALVVDERDAGVDIDDLTLRLGPRITPGLAWLPGTPSNVFIVGEQSTVVLETIGDLVTWRITDFWNAEVVTGEATPVHERVTLHPPARPGYYMVHARARQRDATIVEGRTACAVLPRPERTTAPVWGVATHFAQGTPTSIMPTLAKAGIRLIRDEMYWDAVELERGRWTLPTHFSNYHAAARAAGLETLVLLSYANPLYDNGQTPHSVAGRAAFAAYATAMQRQLPAPVAAWEVWNEYNGGFCEGPASEDRPRHYAALLADSWRALKAADPHAVVLGGAAVLQPLPWFEDIFTHGALQHLDAVVIHPYRKRPEGVDREVDELRALMRRHGGEKPIWVTETGLDSVAEDEWERGLNLYERARADSARYLVRQLTLLRKAGCERLMWYVANDSDMFKAMGLLRQEADVGGTGPFNATAVLVAYATLINQLGERAFHSREGHTPYARSWCLRFGDAADDQVRVCWALEPSAFVLRTDQPLIITDLMGGKRTMSPVDGVVRLPVGPEVVYVQGTVKQVVPVDDGWRALAATDEDFSATQGGQGWHYGYRHGLSGDFRPLEWRRTYWDWRWASSEHGILQQTRDGCEPEGTIEDPWYVDRRWVCAHDGPLVLSGDFSVTDVRSDGVDVHVLVDGVRLWSQVIAGGETIQMRVPVTMRAGGTLDLLVGPHRATAYDACHFDLRVLQTTR